MACFYFQPAFLFCLFHIIFPKHRHKILNQIKIITHNNSFFHIKFGVAFVQNIYFCLILIFVYQKSLNRTFPTSFWVQNHPMKLRSCVVNSQRLFCSKKGGVKCFKCIKAFWYTKPFFFNAQNIPLII